jgi:flagellar hook protein FlgE
MSNAFSIGLSALNANELGIEVAGNNLANLNTPGYKDTVLDFSEIMSQTTDGNQVGMGVANPSTRRLSAQGPLQPNSGPLTAAIQGEGYFTVQGSSGEALYTRVGNFKLDGQGNLLTQSGEKALGVNGTIQIPSGNIPPAATTQMTLDLNLDSSAAIGDAFSAPLKVFDSLGNSHLLTATFTKSDINTWTYAAATGEPGVSAAVTAGTLIFNSNGVLLTPAKSSPNLTIATTGLPSANGANEMTIKWDLYAADGVTPRITQNNLTSATSAQWQDGTAMATLTQVSIGDGGNVVASYSNGLSKTIAQLQLVSFRNPDTLVDVGNNEFKASGSTSAPAMGIAGTGGRGTVAGGSLEGSTVDIATEFTNLIIYQRGYEAGTRIITTANQLTQDTINLIRE